MRRSNIVLLHPLGASAAFWSPVVERLGGVGPEGANALAFDLLGHGQALWPTPRPTVEEYTDDVAARLLRHLGAAPRVVAVGVSLGGLVAQDLALRYQDLVSGLVLCDTVAAYPPAMRTMWRDRAVTARRDGLEALVDFTRKLWFTEVFGSDPVVGRAIRGLLATTAEGYARTCEMLAEVDLSPLVADVRVPTLVVCGRGDGVPFREAAVGLHEAIAGSHLAWLLGRHAAVIEDLDGFVALLAGFLHSSPTPDPR